MSYRNRPNLPQNQPDLHSPPEGYEDEQPAVGLRLDAATQLERDLRRVRDVLARWAVDAEVVTSVHRSVERLVDEMRRAISEHRETR